MANPPASKADRTAFLDRMAQDPTEVLRRWRSLSESEKLTVESRLKTYYGEEFTKQFKAGVAHNPRPDATIEMVRRDRVTPAKLQSAGYRFKDNAGGVEKWIHHSGKQVWFYSEGKAVPRQPDPPDPPVARPQPYPPKVITIGDADERLFYLRPKLKQIKEDEAKTRTARQVDTYDVGSDVDNFFKLAAKTIDEAAEVIKDLNKTLDQGNLTDSEQTEILKQLEELQKLIKEINDMT